MTKITYYSARITQNSPPSECSSVCLRKMPAAVGSGPKRAPTCLVTKRERQCGAARMRPRLRGDGRVVAALPCVAVGHSFVLYFYACRALKITSLPLFFSLPRRPSRSQVTVPSPESRKNSLDDLRNTHFENICCD